MSLPRSGASRGKQDASTDASWDPSPAMQPLGVVLLSGLGCQHSLAGHLGDLAGHDGVDDGVVDVRQALN